MKKLYLDQKPLRLDPDKLIQSGGEGMVFEMGRLAAKVYNRPQAGRAGKLQLLVSRQLAGILPANVFGPCQLIWDENQQVAGFTMLRLPNNSQSARQLANPNFYKTGSFGTRPVVHLLQEIHRTLKELHQQGLVVGDLNDHNIHFAMPGHVDWPSFWIDVDSYQFGDFPCPVAMKTFLDPHLYHVTDFSTCPSFTEATDWYAFFVLLIKSLLLAHPYSGTHAQHKSLASRAQAGISLLNPSVIYPRLARPVESLSDDLLHHLTLVFEKGHRPPFPGRLLAEYASNLHHCDHCGLDYPKSRPGCPACRQQTPAAAPTKIHGRLHVRRLFNTEGTIVKVDVQADGRIQAITRTGDVYYLINLQPDGRQSQKVLFQGHQSYGFAFFGPHYLAVNPAHSRQILLLDLGRQPIEQVALIETTLFRDQAVFACSQCYIFRQVQGLIMRGEIRDGLYLEETIATTRQGQTCIWASALGNLVTGYYRFFDEYHFILISDDGTYYEFESPFSSAGGSIRDIIGLFGRKEVGFLARTFRNGHHQARAAIFGQQGRLLQSFHLNAPELELATELDGKALFGATLLWATDEGIVKYGQNGRSLLADTKDIASQGDILHYHPQGLLIQQNSALFLVSELKDS